MHSFAAGEFVTYYFNGKLWAHTGTLPWTLKWTHLGLLLMRCWCLFRLLTQLISDKMAMAVTWFTMSSGLLAFYGPNYLVNAAGLGLVFAGWWSGLPVVDAVAARRAWRCSKLASLDGLCCSADHGIGLGSPWGLPASRHNDVSP